MAGPNVRFVVIYAQRIPTKTFVVDDISWHLQPVHGKSRFYFALSVGWNPHWRQFSGTSGFKIQPVRVSGLILAGVQLVGRDVDQAAQAIGKLPAHDPIMLRAGTIKIMQPFIQAVKERL